MFSAGTADPLLQALVAGLDAGIVEEDPLPQVLTKGLIVDLLFMHFDD